ncbi:MAG: hypothetical protein FWE45_01785 [Firmicutes bacterium]|nr:hypothetical protein [Bacillota bacterium]
MKKLLVMLPAVLAIVFASVFLVGCRNRDGIYDPGGEFCYERVWVFLNEEFIYPGRIWTYKDFPILNLSYVDNDPFRDYHFPWESINPDTVSSLALHIAQPGRQNILRARHELNKMEVVDTAYLSNEFGMGGGINPSVVSRANGGGAFISQDAIYYSEEDFTFTEILVVLTDEYYHDLAGRGSIWPIFVVLGFIATIVLIFGVLAISSVIKANKENKKEDKK